MNTHALRVLSFAVLFALAMSCDCSDETGIGDRDAGDMDATENDTEDGEPDPDAGNDEDPLFDEECPAYQVKCDGECIPAINDPENCGGCGVECGEGEACSGGFCLDEGECLEGLIDDLEACDGQCINTQWNSDHCGECGNACEDGEGCSFGQCRDAIEFDPPSECPDATVIEFEDDGEEVSLCGGGLAETTFRWGLCSCENIYLDTHTYVDGYNSAFGPYVPGGYGGGLAANGWFVADGDLDLTGNLWAASTEEPMEIGPTTIGANLRSGSDLHVDGEVAVAGDVWVRGDVNAEGAPPSFDVGGTLHLPSNGDYEGDVTYGDIEYEDFDIAEPCTECEPEDRIDIEAIVSARSEDNDNDEIGLDADQFNPGEFDGPTRIELPCGHYYLSGFDVDERITFVATGNTTLYVDGDFVADHRFVMAPEPGAQLDVFIAGDATFDRRTQLGSPDYPALMRMYVGGEGGLTANAWTQFAANVYSVPGGAHFDDRIEVFGSLYLQDADIDHWLDIHFDRHVLDAGQDCPDDDDDNGEPDENDEPGYTCVSDGGTCEQTADCCTPMECIDGSCQFESECAGVFEDCSEADCCAGLLCSVDEVCEVIP